MINLFRQFLFWIEYVFLRLLAWIVNLLDFAVAMRLAEFVGSVMFLRKRRRQISIDNLRLAFPEKSETEIESIGRASMQGIVKTAFEFIDIPTISKNPDRYLEVRGLENTWKALEKKKGLIFTVSHFGNWELMAIASAAKGLPMHAVGRPVKNPFVYEYIKKLRGATGLQSIDQKGAVRSSIQLLKQNKIIAILIDQHIKHGGVWVDFFGRKASTSGFPAMLALKYNVPVIPTYFYREKKTRSVLFFDKPFNLIRTGNYDQDVIANTQQYVASLEAEIRKRPGDWMWMHNRWRAEDYERLIPKAETL